jgi:hypothetical protein
MGRIIGLSGLAGAVLVLASAPAGAIVPPKDCGFMTVSSHRYNIKADQMRCATARSYSSSYLRRHRAPRGYSCHDYKSGTKLKFRCSHGIKVFFAIKR